MSFFGGIMFWQVLLIALIPAVILGIKEKVSRYYTMILSLFFIVVIYAKQAESLIYLLLFVLYQWMLMYICLAVNRGREKKPGKSPVAVFVIVSLLPLFVSRLLGLNGISFGFMGISYITFKAIQMIIEINDGLIKELKIRDYLLFMLFFPTISSGPIDRSRRFCKDMYEVRPRDEYLNMVGEGLEYVLQGLFYKIVLSQLMFDWMTPLAERYRPEHLMLYMYLYGFYLFFDFAGYSLMAVGVSKIVGINTPINFDKPFLAKDIKDFWNRWHISLSHWFRDFVFS